MEQENQKNIDSLYDVLGTMPGLHHVFSMLHGEDAQLGTGERKGHYRSLVKETFTSAQDGLKLRRTLRVR